MSCVQACLRLVGLAALGGMLLASPASAQTYDAVGDFSNVSNPNGAWSYGRTDSSGNGFTLLTSGSYNSNTVWRSSGGHPTVGKNLNSTAPGGFPGWTPGTLLLLPGTGSTDDAVVRWKAPSDTVIKLTGKFRALESSGNATVGVYHRRNNAAFSTVMQATSAGSGDVDSFAAILSIQAGDHVDFRVNANGTNESDGTGLEATLVVVPEPGTLGLLIPVFAGLAARRRRPR